MIENNDKGVNKSVINWYPGHMAKTRRMIKEQYDSIDLVYELVDARIPFSSKIKDVYDLVKNKPKIIIMTKKDLCDAKRTEYWVKYYENLGSKVLLMNLLDKNDINKLVTMTHEIMQSSSNEKGKGFLKKYIKVLVIGIPNVGKSTLINQLAGKKVANTGNIPGVTKKLNWIKTNSDILLLDTPGILYPRIENHTVALNLACMTAIKEEVIPIDEVAIHILKMLEDYYPKILEEKYNLRKIEDINEAYETIGSSIGAMKHGEVNTEKVSLKIINDIKSERIKGVTFDVQ